MHPFEILRWIISIIIELKSWLKNRGHAKFKRTVVRLKETEDVVVEDIKGSKHFDEIVSDTKGKRTKIRHIEGK